MSERHRAKVPDRITFFADDETRKALSEALAVYAPGPGPSLSAVIREAIFLGLPQVVAARNRVCANAPPTEAAPARAEFRAAKVDDATLKRRRSGQGKTITWEEEYTYPPPDDVATCQTECRGFMWYDDVCYVGTRRVVGVPTRPRRDGTCVVHFCFWGWET